MATNSSSNITTAASGKVLQGQGVGVANAFSTATYPSTAGTTGNFMVSNGTNFVSTDLGQLKMTPLITLTSAQIKALHATPIEVVAAPPAGYLICPVMIWANYVYGGSNVFTAAAGQTIGLYYGSTALITGGISILTNTQLTTSSSLIKWAPPSNTTPLSVPASTYYATNVTVYNPSATEISGNAANDNTLYFRFMYTIIQLG